MVGPGKGKGPSFFAKYAPPGYKPPTEDEEDEDEDPEEKEIPDVESEVESSTFRDLGSLPSPQPYEPTFYHSGFSANSGTNTYLRSPYDPVDVTRANLKEYPTSYPSSDEYSSGPSVNQPEPMPPPPLRKPYVHPTYGTVCINTPRKTTGTVTEHNRLLRNENEALKARNRALEEELEEYRRRDRGQ